MKILMFHLMPYRQFSAHEFENPNHGLHVNIPSFLFDPEQASRYYRESLEELEFGAAVGFDGICVNEHHQMAYGMMPSPNLLLATLTRRTEDVALVTLGTSVALYNPPTRVAEEYSVLDNLSGGRVIAGFPVGTSMDSNYAYGVNPATLRERYYEAVELILRAWTDPEPFSFDGQYTQLRYVSIWPRPFQHPRPSVWIPGGHSIETWNWSIEHEFLYAHLSYNGYKRAEASIAAYWDVVSELGREQNPYRTAFLQMVCVGDSPDQLEETYGPHVEYFFNKLLGSSRFTEAPGYRSLESIRASLSERRPVSSASSAKGRTWKDLVEAGVVVAGKPKEVTEELEHLTKTLRCGHLLVLPQIGSMPHDTAMENIRRIGTEVIPNLRHLWDDTEYQDDWWIRPARDRAGV